MCKLAQVPEQDRVLMYATLPSDVIVPRDDLVHLKVTLPHFWSSAQHPL